MFSTLGTSRTIGRFTVTPEVLESYICYFRSFLSGRFPILNYTELTGKFDYTMHIRLDADIVAYHGKTEKLETPMSAEQTSQEYSQSKRTVDFGDYTQDTYQQGDTGMLGSILLILKL